MPAGRPRFITVVDTDALLASVDNHTRSSRPTRILRMTNAETSYLYAADHVYREVYARLPKIAATTPSSLDDLRACFEQQYLPQLVFVTVFADNEPGDRVGAVTDVTDRPTAILADLVAPCLVLSGDKHLRKSGFAPTDWRAAAHHGAAVADANLHLQSTTSAVALPVVGAVAGVSALGRRIGVAPWLIATLVACGGWLLLDNPQRRKTTKEVLGYLGTYLLETITTASAQERAGLAELHKVLLEPVEPLSLKHRVAAVLARAHEPLLAGDLQAELSDHNTTPTPTVAEIRSVLEACPEFTTPQRHRWQLGRPAGPRTN